MQAATSDKKKETFQCSSCFLFGLKFVEWLNQSMCFASKFVYVCVYIYIYIVRCNYDIQFLPAIFDVYKMTTKYINIYHFFTPPSNLPKTTKGLTFVLSRSAKKKRYPIRVTAWRQDPTYSQTYASSPERTAKTDSDQAQQQTST